MSLWERLFWGFYAVCMLAIAGCSDYRLYRIYKDDWDADREFQRLLDERAARKNTRPDEVE